MPPSTDGAAHLLRDHEDAAQSYPDAIWPGQIAGALRALIHEADQARAQGLDAVPGDRTGEHIMLLRRGVAVGLSDVRRAPGANIKQAARPGATGMPARPAGRRAAVPHRYRHPPDEQPSRT